MTSRNSPASGSSLSRPMIARHSLSGRPDFMPRTTMSMALGSSVMNFSWRRAVALLTNQRGAPNTPMSPAAMIKKVRGPLGGSESQTRQAKTTPLSKLASQ